MGTSGAALVAGKPLDHAIGAQRVSEGASAIRTVDMQEDVTLVRRTLAGDQQAFSSIVEKYKDSVFNVAYRMLGNPTEAEDVAQETFVRAYTQLHTYKDTHRFSTWLLSIASHLSIDQLAAGVFWRSRWRTCRFWSGSPTLVVVRRNRFWWVRHRMRCSASSVCFPPNTGRFWCCATGTTSPMRRLPRRFI